MEIPERMRKQTDSRLTVRMEGAEPTIRTIAQANSNTMPVRIAVATSASVRRIPHLANMEVIPANRADKQAVMTHIIYPIKRFASLF